MTQVIAENIHSVLKYRGRIFSFLTFGLIISSFLYVYFLHNAISNVVEREKIVKENRVISTAVGELEVKYFSIKNSINIELAYSKGFKDAAVSSFIPKDSITAMAHANGL